MIESGRGRHLRRKIASSLVQTSRVVNYVIKRIEPELWRRVKARAAKEGRTVRFVVLELLRVYATHGYKAIEVIDEHERR